MPHLSVKRAADRRKMAQAVRDLCDELGVMCEVETFDESGHRCTLVHTSHDSGLRVSVSFDGEDNMDRAGQFLVPWNLYGEQRLASSFGQVNAYHRQKATHFVQGFEAVLSELRRGYESALDGSAFEPSLTSVARPQRPRP